MCEFFAVKISVNGNLPTLVVVSQPADAGEDVAAKVAIGEIQSSIGDGLPMAASAEQINKAEYDVLWRFAEYSPEISQEDVAAYQ